MARAYQARTLTTGWWGFFSALITPVFLLANAVSLRTERRRLPDPRPAHPSADAVLRGKPLLARPAALAMIVLLVAIGSWFAWGLTHPTIAAAELDAFVGEACLPAFASGDRLQNGPGQPPVGRPRGGRPNHGTAHIPTARMKSHG